MKESALNKLTAKKARFVQEYVIDLNGAAAAGRAGYSLKTAKQQASRLLTNVDVRAAVTELQAAAAERLDITVDYITGELVENHRLARVGNPVLDRYGNPTGAYVRNLSASNKALDQLAEISGLKPDRNAIVIMDISKMNAEELTRQETELLRLKAEIEAKQMGVVLIEGQVLNPANQAETPDRQITRKDVAQASGGA